MKYEAEKIRNALRLAFENMELDPSNIDKAIFHMTDWLDDINNLCKFYEKPESLNAKELNNLVMAFLVHAPAHIAAASKLVTGLPVSDVFDVGATSEDKT